ncbi:unnamed protein product [Owenia fusiformis]|uniref:Uncharacterized protein n=1 Tax=Owenia fusiformis TaxID=6347 RepID=A0A8S4NLA9_OWEFU|nr:unnamed protein product [Owenia fusiformis]
MELQLSVPTFWKKRMSNQDGEINPETHSTGTINGDCQATCSGYHGNYYDDHRHGDTIDNHVNNCDINTDDRDSKRTQSHNNDVVTGSGNDPSNYLSVSIQSRDFSRGSVSSNLSVVNITDITGAEDSIHLTTTVLKRCKRQVLRPYWRLLTVIGWREFGKESVNANGKCWRFLNVVYPVFISLLLLYTYIYQILVCQWRLNVSQDTQPVIIQPALPRENNITSTNSTTVSYPWLPISPSSHSAVNATKLTKITGNTSPRCDHVITTYVIPSLLHFIAYILGIFYFRIMEAEQLYALLEKVFLQATALQGRVASQAKIIGRLRLFLALGAVWVILSVGLHVLFMFAFGLDTMAHNTKTSPARHWSLFGVDLLGTMLLNSVNVAIVMNYGTQCETLVFYIKGISTRIQEKSVDLRYAMKDILAVRQSLSSLNSTMAQMTSLVVFTFAEMVIIGISILVLNRNDQAIVWVYRSIFPIVYSLILIFPLTQAARIISMGSKFKKLALESRVFGYGGCSPGELDSFLTFIGQTHLRAKLFHIPMKAGFLVGFLVVTSLALLLLFQTNLIVSTRQLL